MTFYLTLLFRELDMGVWKEEVVILDYLSFQAGNSPTLQ